MQRTGASRRLGFADAVLRGVAAMMGPGLFIVFGPAIARAGDWLPVATVLAALTALLNALTRTDLVTRYPEFGRARHGAGRVPASAAQLTAVASLVGCTAAAAVAGRVFAGYVLPNHPRPTALAVIAVVGAVGMIGLRFTYRATRLLVPALAAVLLVVVVIGSVRRVPADWSVTGLGEGGGPSGAVLGVEPTALPPVTAFGVLTAAGLMFFGFAALSRLAGLGGAVRPRALAVSALLALLGYLILGAALRHALGVGQLAADDAPLATAVGGADAPALGVLVRVGAAAATSLALLRLLPGAGSTLIGLVGGRPTPMRVIPLVAALGLAALLRPTVLIAVAACAALVQHALLHLAALRLPGRRRRVLIAVPGLALCIGLAGLLPTVPAAVTCALLVVGVLLLSALSSAERPRPGFGRPGVSGAGSVPP
jgi:APA family basic amino acid/polyamine antiporter